MATIEFECQGEMDDEVLVQIERVIIPDLAGLVGAYLTLPAPLPYIDELRDQVMHSCEFCDAPFAIAFTRGDKYITIEDSKELGVYSLCERCHWRAIL